MRPWYVDSIVGRIEGQRDFLSQSLRAEIALKNNDLAAAERLARQAFFSAIPIFTDVSALTLQARLRLAPDTASRNIESPQELLRMLRQSKRLQKYYESLNPSMRRYIAKWVGEGKHSETRERRAEQLAERLMQTMEAERELPPVLQAALVHNPRARAGWELMPPSHRRNHLLSIFYYRNPESRARRVAKAVEMMLEYAEKRGNQAKPRNSQ